MIKLLPPGRINLSRRCMKKMFLLFSFFLVVVCSFYWGLWNTFFQQDEWLGFGQAIYQTYHIGDIFKISGIHFFPLGQLFWMFIFYLFGFHSWLFSVTSLFLHALTTLIAFYLFKQFTKKPTVSFLLAILFAVSFPSRQVVVWSAVLTSLAPVALVIFSFFLILFFFIKQKRIGLKENIILGVIFLLGTLLKEDIYILLPLLPVFLFLFARDKISGVFRKVLPLFIFMLVIIVTRFLYGTFATATTNYDLSNHKSMIVYNVVATPIKMIVQNAIDAEDLWNIDIFFTKPAYPWLAGDGRTITTTIFDEIVLGLALPILLWIGYALAKLPKYEKKLLLFSLVWLAVCALVIAPQTRYMYALESRYMFISSFGFFLLFYTLFYSLLLGKNMYIKRFSIAFTYVSIIVFLGYSLFSIQNRLQQYYIPTSQQRVSIVQQIQKTYPTISRNTVFYVSCAVSSCNELILPFQSGVGQMLLVIYGLKDTMHYNPFMKDLFLWDWEAEGYKNIQGYGFGYFRTFTKVQSLVADKKITPDDVKAFSYNPKTNKIIDISSSISAVLKNEKK